jgi:hypothetical protein
MTGKTSHWEANVRLLLPVCSILSIVSSSGSLSTFPRHVSRCSHPKPSPARTPLTPAQMQPTKALQIALQVLPRRLIGRNECSRRLTLRVFLHSPRPLDSKHLVPDYPSRDDSPRLDPRHRLDHWQLSVYVASGQDPSE